MRVPEDKEGHQLPESTMVIGDAEFAMCNTAYLLTPELKVRQQISEILHYGSCPLNDFYSN